MQLKDLEREVPDQLERALDGLSKAGRWITSWGFRRRRRLTALLLILALLAAVGGGSTYTYEYFKQQVTSLQNAVIAHLEAGQSELEAAKTSLKQANATPSPNLIVQAKSHFTAAKTQFTAARQLADGSSLLRTAEGLPEVGTSARSKHKAVDQVSAMGIQLALAGIDLANLDGEIIAPASHGGQAGRDLLATMQLVQARIGPVRHELAAALSAAREVDLSQIPSSQRAGLQHAVDSIGTALSAIDQLEKLMPIITEVLGGNGARNYLIEQLNPGELRPGGGFIGTYSVLRADHGNLSLVRSGNAADLIFPRALPGQAGYVQPPAPFEKLLQGLSWSFIDSNFFVDFPSNATTGVAFAGPRLRVHIDAVIAIDIYTVAAFLGMTGPITVPGSRLTLTAANFVPTLAQYDIEAVTDPAAAAVHKAILSEVAGPLLQRIFSLKPAQWPALISTLNGLAASRNMQAYSSNADIERTLTQYGWSGVVNSGSDGDFMMEVEANLGATKANFFVTRHYTVELTRGGSVLHHRVILDIEDSMPYAYAPKEYYDAYIRILTSGAADSMSTSLSYPHHETAAPPGTKQLDGWILMHGYGHHLLITFDWNTPWSPDESGLEQIYWQKQPGTPADKVDIVWNYGNGHIYKTSGDLARDRVINLSPSGVSLTQGQVGTAQLPSLSLG